MHGLALLVATISLLPPQASGGRATAAEPTATARLRAPLEPLQFLVGACWSGKLPNGSTDTHCYSPVFDGQFVRDLHKVDSAPKAYEGETLYHWDPSTKQVRFTYYNSLGGVSVGTLHAEAGHLVFPEIYEGPDGRKIEMRSVWSRQGPDSYVALTESREGDGWKERFRVTFTRVVRTP